MDYTKKIIIDAFLTLLSEKWFNDLSVTAIIQKAGFSRSTFYLHFNDKYELLNQVRKTLHDELLSFYQPGMPSSKVVTYNLCSHILKYRSFYKMEFSDANAVLNLSGQLADELDKAFGDRDYAIFASHGTVGYLNQWLKDGFLVSPAEASEKLLKIGLTNWAEALE